MCLFYDQNFSSKIDVKSLKTQIFPMNFLKIMQKNDLSLLIEEFITLIYQFGSFNEPKTFFLEIQKSFEICIQTLNNSEKELFNKGLILIRSILESH